MNWQNRRAERLEVVKTLGSTKRCIRCKFRKPTKLFPRWIQDGKVTVHRTCTDCGGQPPLRFQKSVLGGPPVERAPKFKPGYEPGRAGMGLDALLAHHKNLHFMKGYGTALRTLRLRLAGRLEEGACWAACKKIQEEFEVLKEEFLQKAKWEDEQP